MKLRHLISTTVLACVSSVALAGLVQPAPVIVDLDGGFALGDMRTARESKNDVELIGCGATLVDDGAGGATVSFGFCQASDADGVQILCFTTNKELLKSLDRIADYSFISFSWVDDGAGGAECTRIRVSTQSFYLPKK